MEGKVRINTDVLELDYIMSTMNPAQAMQKLENLREIKEELLGFKNEIIFRESEDEEDLITLIVIEEQFVFLDQSIDNLQIALKSYESIVLRYSLFGVIYSLN